MMKNNGITKVCGSFQSSHLNFCFGLTIGLVLAFLVSSFSTLQGPLILTKKLVSSRLSSYLTFRSLQEVSESYNDMHEYLDKRIQQDKVRQVEFKDEHQHHDDDSVARNLSETVRVLCWIMTGPQNLDKKAIHVKNTWGKRCSKLIFFSSITNTSFPTIGLNISEGREHLTGKTMQGFRYVFNNFFNEYDWFLKADDDSYFIMENLRYFLSSQNTSEPIYFGQHFKVIVKQGYYSGGAGYILSKEALRRFGTTRKNPKYCRQDGGSEDVELGKCMQYLGVKTANSTDSLGRSRFHCFDPETHIMGKYGDWYYHYDANGAKKGLVSVSDYAISFHYMQPRQMWALEYYLYHLSLYGVFRGLQNLNKRNISNRILGR